MKLSSLNQLASLIGIETKQKVAITGVAVDTRLVSPGDIFIALPGEKADGHQFLEEAAKKGASCFLLNKNYKGSCFGLPALYTEDPLFSLQLLAKKVLEKSHAKIVAITGSVGKTTTKDFLTTLLQEKYVVAKTPGNANSQIGLPLAILNHTDGKEDVLVLEMGMNAKGHIEKLVEIAPPDIAVLTHVGLAHAASFDSLLEIAKEKAQIFKHPKTKIAILNGDMEHLDVIMQIGTCEKLLFSVACKQTGFYLDNFTLHTSKDGFFRLDPSLHPFFGKHHYQNLLAACAVACHLGLSFEEIKRAEAKLSLPEKRFEVKEISGITFINDSYNASESSLIAALEALPKPKKGGRVIAVIGEMLELGKFSKACHERVGKKALVHADLCFLFGKECKPIYSLWKENKKPVKWFLGLGELRKALKAQVFASDVVLLKGSSANQLWTVLEEF
ncbi:MAG TPA: UDP-N-acetylmuramoyl-tripeptide--D-alanyl-D-alanine ligase [Parachlamydiaceae bacterium]|nr:UDP-N-acetylmuramoyl-tripeptide--D-alanyl-D-alanine ligase [Parachlamydiaceae bacterium]